MLTASAASSSRSAKHISGSIIQNSAKWRLVWEFSARKVGPKVYTSERAQACVSTFNCPDTVRLHWREKKSLVKSTRPSAVLGMSATLTFSGNSEVTVNCSPAPSQSAAVMRGV